jgi:hypothetical protein
VHLLFQSLFYFQFLSMLYTLQTGSFGLKTLPLLHHLYSTC